MIRITALVENAKGEHSALRNEHGLSFYIETPGHKVLFDTGQSGAFLHNADELRIDLADVKQVVISHGHYDHSGGVRLLLERTTDFDLVVGSGFFEEKYAAIGNGGYEFLGNSFTAEFLRSKEVRYREVSDPVQELAPGIYAVSGFPRLHADEVINERFKLLKGGEFVPDPFDDELMLVVDSPKGLIALLGCSHPGMRNMLDAVKSHFGKRIYGVLGGTHLVEACPESMKASVEYLRAEELGLIGVCHCTGAEGANLLEAAEVAYVPVRTGSCLVLP